MVNRDQMEYMPPLPDGIADQAGPPFSGIATTLKLPCATIRYRSHVTVRVALDADPVAAAAQVAALVAV